MKKIILIAAILGALQTNFAQQFEIQMIDSNLIIKDLKLSGTDSDFYSTLDYEALLFLHPDDFDLLNKLKPATLHLTKYEEYSGAISELPFHSREIKSLFGYKEKFKQIIKKVSLETEFKYGDIFLKSPDKIFVNIYGDMWASSYGFRLEEGKLKLKYEIKNIE